VGGWGRGGGADTRGCGGGGSQIQGWVTLFDGRGGDINRTLAVMPYKDVMKG
jgi:hypothetical protein